MSNSFYDIIGKSVAKEPTAWGFHLICDARGTDPSTVNSADTVSVFLDKIVDKLKMIPVGQNIVREFNDGNGRGVSGLKMLTTSHVSCHTDNVGMSAYIDVFSCNKYEPKTALDIIVEFFNPKNMLIKWVIRNDDVLKVENISYNYKYIKPVTGNE